MGKKKGKKKKLIEAAGGLLWRRTSSGLKIAVVYRKRYGGDWTLPKGKLKPLESWQEAALREVREETGWKASILSFAGATAYETDAGPKIVKFWNMTVAIGAHPSELIGNEVSKVVWLSPARAIKKLSYSVERAILEAWRNEKILA